MATALRVLFEDNHHLVVWKPAGLLAQGDVTGDPTLIDHAKAHRKEHENKTGDTFIGLVHRLDRPASGVVVLAKTSKAAARLSAQFRDRTVGKRYLIRVRGTVAPRRKTWSDRILREDTKSRVHPDHPDAKDARLSYEVLDTFEQGETNSLLSIQLETGRRHQIRVQAGSRGHPVLGDLRYGATEPLPDKSIALHAHRLEFDHVISGERLAFTASAPDWARLSVNVREVQWEPAAGLLCSIRHRVFVIGQGVPAALEMDGTDPEHRHWLVETRDGRAIGTARAQVENDTAHLSRVGILEAYRGLGVGSQLIRHLMTDLTAEWRANGGGGTIDLHSQTHACRFYEHLGFKAEGDEFIEADIPHRQMVQKV